jgi:hypothetical protein
MNSAKDQQLIRGMGLLQATAANMLKMIGIGLSFAKTSS